MMIQGLPGQSPIKMVPVDANMLESIGYSTSTRKLYVKFRNRPVQCFDGVPGFRFQGLMSAPRKDAYFKSFIQNQFLVKEMPSAGA